VSWLVGIRLLHRFQRFQVKLEIVLKVSRIPSTDQNQHPLTCSYYPITADCPRDWRVLTGKVKLGEVATIKVDSQVTIIALKIDRIAMLIKNFLEQQFAIKETSKQCITSSQDHILIE